ncbi:MAG: hypothetical protein NZM42_14870, partial [Gemmatales bacterium]|nr:hypothetical protein [Gemmatales bacterium]MDW8223172.1 hypothetical protein [Gemmatales bacterium]
MLGQEPVGGVSQSSQVGLFDTRDITTGLYADVVFPGPMDRSWRYAVPEAWLQQVEAGKRVLAPFGRSNRGVIG